MALSFNYTEKRNLGRVIFNQNTQISDTCKTEHILDCFIQFMQSVWNIKDVVFFLSNLMCQI